MMILMTYGQLYMHLSLIFGLLVVPHQQEHIVLSQVNEHMPSIDQVWSCCLWGIGSMCDWGNWGTVLRFFRWVNFLRRAWAPLHYVGKARDLRVYDASNKYKECGIKWEVRYLRIKIVEERERWSTEHIKEVNWRRKKWRGMVMVFEKKIGHFEIPSHLTSTKPPILTWRCALFAGVGPRSCGVAFGTTNNRALTLVARNLGPSTFLEMSPMIQMTTGKIKTR